MARITKSIGATAWLQELKDSYGIENTTLTPSRNQFLVFIDNNHSHRVMVGIYNKQNTQGVIYDRRNFRRAA